MNDIEFVKVSIVLIVIQKAGVSTETPALHIVLINFFTAEAGLSSAFTSMGLD